MLSGHHRPAIPDGAEIWAIVAAFLPAVLTVTLPMAVLMGILTGFSRLSSDSEAIAMRASGISMRRILRPVLVFATLAWAVTLALTVWITPTTTSNLRTYPDGSGAEVSVHRIAAASLLRETKLALGAVGQ